MSATRDYYAAVAEEGLRRLHDGEDPMRVRQWMLTSLNGTATEREGPGGPVTIITFPGRREAVLDGGAA